MLLLNNLYRKIVQGLNNTLINITSPFQIPDAAGEAWVIYSVQKSARIGGKLVCPLVEPFLEDRLTDAYTYVMLGSLNDKEAIPSYSIKLQIRLLEFASAQFLAGWPRLSDLRFIYEIYRPELVFPNRFRLLHVLRTWLLARYYSVKFSFLASACSSAYVTVYYNATMLGVVSAFRRKGKVVWDVQHGHLGSSHDAYNNKFAFSLNSYYKPTCFLVWSKDFGRYLESTHGAIWRSSEYAHLKMLPISGPPLRTWRTRVLFTLQWGTPIPSIVLIKAAEAGSKINWMFRMHPFEKSSRPEITSLCTLPNVCLVDCKEPLAESLRRADIHVTFNSSVVHEAAVLNIPSIFFDSNVTERFELESKRKLAYLSDDAGFEVLLSSLVSGSSVR